MRYLGREGYLLFFDDILPEFEIGGLLATEDETLKIVYVDRENGELGCLPAGKKERKLAKRARRQLGRG